MPLLKLNARLRRTATRNNRVPAALVSCRHIAWDGHDLVVLSRFDVIRD